MTYTCMTLCAWKSDMKINITFDLPLYGRAHVAYILSTCVEELLLCHRS